MTPDLFKVLFATSPDALLYIEDRKVVIASASAANLFGFERADDLVNTHSTNLLPPHPLDQRSIFEWAQILLEENPSSARLDWLCRHQNGTIFSARIRLQPILTEDHQGFCVLVRHFEERHEFASQNLPEDNIQLSQFLESVIDNADVWLNVLDNQANVLIWNKAAELISGYEKKEVQNTSKIWEWLYPDQDYRAWVGARVAEILSKGHVTQDLETTIVTKQGKQRVISWDSRTIHDHTGKISGSIAIGHDVTEAKQAQAALIEAKKAAEHAAKVKSDFLANMSHEIRTPINAMIGFSSLALKQPLTPKLQDYLTKIETAGHSLLSIVNDVLDFSKIEAGKMQIEKTPFDLRQVLANIIDLLSPKASEKKLALVLDSESKYPPALVGDPLRLQQVLLNLASNALKFTEYGHVVICTEILERTQDSLQLCFSVKDTGVGISPEQQKCLFEAFVQADSSTTRKFGGTGLGLAISKHLIELMGGKIWVTSTPNQGSIFNFTAKFNIAEQLPAPGSTPLETICGNNPQLDLVSCSTKQPDVHQLRNGHILLVEDNAINRELALELLAGSGLTIDCATNGQEAIAMINETHYDAVLMDIQMPEMDGKEATALIRKNPQHQTLPIIAMTAHALAGYREECIAAGMNDYITKPIDQTLLINTLSHWVIGTEKLAAPLNTPTRDKPSDGATREFEALENVMDVSVALGRVKGQRHLLARILDKAIVNLSQPEMQITNALRGGDIKAALRITHTIKGIAGTFGATDLCTKAQHLETALYEGQPWEEHYIQFSKANDDFKASLNAWQASHQKIASCDKKSDVATLEIQTTLLNNLEEQLQRNAIAARDTVEKLIQVSSPHGCVALMQIREALFTMDFVKARTCLLKCSTILKPHINRDCPQ